MIRDFPKAAMGLIDYSNQPKHAVEDWDFHGDRMILLQTDMDRRSFESGMSARVELFPRDFSATEDASELELTLRDADGAARWSATRSVGRSDGETPLSFDVQFPRCSGRNGWYWKRYGVLLTAPR